MAIPSTFTGAATFVASTRVLTVFYEANDKTGTEAGMQLTVTDSAGTAFTSTTDVTAAVATFGLTIVANPCEGTKISSVAFTAVADQTYTLGATGLVITWPVATYVTDPADQTCALTYAATTATSAVEPAVTVDNTARTLTVSTSTASMVSTTNWVYTVAVKTPSGVTISGTTATINILISANAACEPPATTTTATTTAQSFTIGASSSDLVFLWSAWTYVTDPTGGSCTLGYAATVPTALSAALACVASTRTCTLTNASVTEAMAGVHELSVTGTTPTGTAIASKTATVALTILSECTSVTSATAPTTAEQTFKLDGTAQSYTVGAWTASVGTLDCATDLKYVWTIPTALTAYVTTSTTSRTFSFTSSEKTLATSTGHTITLAVTTSAGVALTSGGSVTFTLLATAVTSAADSSVQAVV